MSRRELESLTRREWFRYAGVVAGGAMAARAGDSALFADTGGSEVPPYDLPQAAADPLDERRKQMGAAPIVSSRLGPNLVMLSGPGGNVAALHGADGIVIVDTFVKPAWAGLKQNLDGLGGALKLAIDTHWHFDHADNNDRAREAGAATLAHENTRKRLAEPHDLLGMKFPASSPASLPTQTFRDSHAVYANGEMLHLIVREARAHRHGHRRDVRERECPAHGRPVLQRLLPVHRRVHRRQHQRHDRGSRHRPGAGQRASAGYPGHGPLGDKASLGKYRDMMVTVRDRIQKLKSSGQTLEQVVAAKPTKDLTTRGAKDSCSRTSS